MSQIVSIQILRAAAALLVVFGHAQSYVGASVARAGGAFQSNSLLPWGAGVDLFFVISGFVMVVSSERLFAQPGAAREFVLRRLIRIVPLYWLSLGYLLVRSALSGRPLPDGASIAASVLFVTWLDDKGAIRPIYELGWTLNYEMFFYVAFAAFLWAQRERAVLLSASLLLTLVAAGATLGFSSVQLDAWSQPIILEFIFGMAIAVLFRRDVRIPAWLGTGLACGALAILLLDFMNSTQQPVGWVVPNGFGRAFYWGLPCAVLVAGLVLSKRSGIGAGPTEAFAAHIGDASYSLYLLHPFLLGVLTTLWFKAGLGALLSPWVCVAAGVVLSIALALASYRWFEAPVTQWLRDALSRERPRAGQAAA